MNYIKFATNLSQSMVFNYNKGLKKDGKFGKQWMWGVNQGGVEAMLTATERLNEILEEIQPKGRLIEILKYEDGVKKMWKILENGQDITPQYNSSPKTAPQSTNTQYPTSSTNPGLKLNLEENRGILVEIKDLKEKIKQLNINQDKLVDKIKDLDQICQGLYGALINEENEQAYELHKSIKLKKVEEPEEEVNLNDLPF